MWFQRHVRTERLTYRPELASDDEKRRAFDEWHDHLYWTALLITGSPEKSSDALVDAAALAENEYTVFRDWLIQWTRDATSRMAIEKIRESILTASATYEQKVPCSHSDHTPLTIEQIDAIRQLPMEVVHAGLDPFARAVLALRGIKQDSITNCARVLGVPRMRVLAAYCMALHWAEQSLVCRNAFAID